MTFIYFAFLHFFLAEASLFWEAQGRQDQPPIDKPLAIYSISSPALHCSVVVLFLSPFHDRACKFAFIITSVIISNNLRGVYVQREI